MDKSKADILAKATATDHALDSIRNADLGQPSNRGSKTSVSNDGLVKENEFLKDLGFKNTVRKDAHFWIVYRLNGELGRFREKYPDQTLDHVSDVDKSKDTHGTSKLLDRETMVPLFDAYDERIRDMKKQVDLATNETQSLRAESKALKLENSRLKQRISDDEKAAPFVNNMNYQEWDLANDRIRMISEENDMMLEHHKTLTSDLVKTKADLANAKDEAHRSTLELSEVLQRMNDYKSRCEEAYAMKQVYETELAKSHNATKLFEVENHKLSSDIDRLKAEYASCQAKLTEAKKTATAMTLAYKNSLRDMGKFENKETAMVNELKGLEAHSHEILRLYEQATEELQGLHQERVDMIATMSQMELQIKDLDAMLVEMHRKLDVSATESQEALLDKEKAVLKEEQAQKDVKRLEDRLRTTLQRQQEILKAEVDAVKEHFSADKRKLLEEIGDLQVQKADIQIQHDRALREKRFAETEAEKMKIVLPQELERMNGTVDTLHERVRRYELEAFDAQNQLEAFQTKLSREENRFEHERQSLGAEISVLNQRVRHLEGEADEAKQDQIRLFTKLQEVDQRLTHVLAEKSSLVREHESSLQQHVRKSEFERNDWTQKQALQTAANEKLSKEIQELLSQQQKMAKRWKEETRDTIVKYDRIISDLQERLKKSEERFADLNQKFTRVNILNDELMSQTEQEKHSHAKLHSLVKNAESRAQASSQQVRILLAREMELIEETKSYQRTIDQISLENKRIQRSNKNTEKRQSLGLQVFQSQAPMLDSQKVREKLKLVESLNSSVGHMSMEESQDLLTDTKENNVETP